MNQDRALSAHMGIIRRLNREIADARRRTDSAQRDTKLFVSELMLIRLEQGLTQAQLAKRAGLHQTAIARVESGKANPTLETLIKLARALNRRLVVE
jgi:DNA-binding XRE family transcriptional regulator